MGSVGREGEARRGSDLNFFYSKKTAMHKHNSGTQTTDKGLYFSMLCLPLLYHGVSVYVILSLRVISEERGTRLFAFFDRAFNVGEGREG